MSITLITGVPGTGKTASAVQMMTEFVGKRPIFSMGIRDLKVEHQPVPPVEKWTVQKPLPEDPSITAAFFDFPPNSIIFIDECQTIYRPRPNGSKVPDFVAANETHRHTGVDFVLMTQHPSLVDANVRKFIDRHIHIRKTPLGRFKHEWTELGDVDSASSRAISRKDRFKPPKNVFNLYKSSELHTKIKIRLPMYVYVFAISSFALVGSAWYASLRIKAHQKPQDLSILGVPNSSELGINQRTLSNGDYFANYLPRDPARQESAPAYDELILPKAVPVAIACYESNNTGCKCINQQGSRYQTTEYECRSIIKNGDRFRPWEEEKEHLQAARHESTFPVLINPQVVGEQFPPENVSKLVDSQNLKLGT